MQIRKLQDKILKILFQKLHREDCIIFLFGTHAQGEAIHASDIDIGLLSCVPVPPKNFLEAQEALNSSLPTLRKIDLVDFGAVSPKVKGEALREIKIWHIGKNCTELSKSLKRPLKN
ncbi:MAG: nucleotidyltransferase domain-containing protein [Deltaproteobacteria bacterium]|nr:nucleotidyltransferase domain-containing protein [Deltaproteobacteria bacterium]MBI4223627.1 nucleotidyltransferase domain-containing protein [Deltaproteobacteria bacterium]